MEQIKEMKNKVFFNNNNFFNSFNNNKKYRYIELLKNF